MQTRMEHSRRNFLNNLFSVFTVFVCFSFPFFFFSFFKKFKVSHNTKCIFCHGKKPSYLLKYKWEAIFEFFNATQSTHQSAYLSNEFARKGFGIKT